MNQFFNRPTKYQDQEYDRQAHQNDVPLANAASSTKTCGQPDARCSGEAKYMLAFFVAKNDSRT